jgi:hypothetical protein
MSGLLAVGVLLSAFVWAQSPRGSIVGRVTDATASSLAGAKVVVVTGASSSTVTADGEYTIPSLDPGVYRVTVSAPGGPQNLFRSIREQLVTSGNVRS